METWAVDLAEIGAIYPWQGSEKIMVLVAVIAWLVWHVVQARAESREYAEDIAKHGSTENIRASLDKE